MQIAEKPLALKPLSLALFIRGWRRNQEPPQTSRMLKGPANSGHRIDCAGRSRRWTVRHDRTRFFLDHQSDRAGRSSPGDTQACGGSMCMRCFQCFCHDGARYPKLPFPGGTSRLSCHHLASFTKLILIVFLLVREMPRMDF